jgi:hypothetical protein
MKKFVLFGWILFSPFSFSQQDTDFAYLGVHTSRLDQGLSHQLGLPPGAHLRIDRVAQGSPAENAGLKLYDILLKLDDQLLINPDQLKTLVQMRNPGERISLSVLRQSKPITVSVKLLEMPEELRDRQNRDWMDDRDPFDFDGLFPQDRFRDFFRRHSFDFPDLTDFYRQPFFSNPGLDAPSVAPGSPDQSGIDDPLHSGGTDVQTYSYSSSTQQVTVSDEEGSLQWTEKDGLRFLRATDLDGEVLFEGAITTEEDRKKLPDGVGQRLRTMQQAGQIPID